LSVGTVLPAHGFLASLAASLDVPPSRYDEAEKRYKSVGEWLGRDDSTLKDLSPDVYVQGSFRLGTPIPPISEGEHYDIDLVCELDASKTTLTQSDLKSMLGVEIGLYAKAHRMTRPEEGRRCWTLQYADGAQFHLDALPAIPDGNRVETLLLERGLDASWASTAIAITDVDHPRYSYRCDDWPHSNPRGYTNWFRSRMKDVFERQREAMALQERASVEEIPSYRVKTPLQQAVQILKRHRDMMFVTDPDDKPISVIITTLAGLAYRSESEVGFALDAILAKMDDYIEYRRGVAWIANPTDAAENFADRWSTNPSRRMRFYDWLAAARRDLSQLTRESNRERLGALGSAMFGERASNAAVSAMGRPATAKLLLERFVPTFRASHRKVAPWPRVRGGEVSIETAMMGRLGFRPQRVYSDGSPLPKNASLTFKASTDIPQPFEVFWQVVNTGAEAAAVNGGLRGGFDKGTVDRGSIVRRESTEYTGTHSIECFIVKSDYLVARSGPFIVNVA